MEEMSTSCKILKKQHLGLLGGSLAPCTPERRWIVKITPRSQLFYEDSLYIFLELILFIQTPLLVGLVRHPREKGGLSDSSGGTQTHLAGTTQPDHRGCVLDASVRHLFNPPSNPVWGALFPTTPFTDRKTKTDVR